MSEMIYIKDDFGTQIPLLDANGNLSLQVIMLFTEDKLSETDRKVVLDFVATDEMSQDALEGFALTGNPSKTRHTIGQLNAGIQKRSGAKAISVLIPQREEFDYRKLAAAIALLVVVGGGTFLLSQFFGKEELADASQTELKEDITPIVEPVVSDSLSPEETPEEEIAELESPSDVENDEVDDAAASTVREESEKESAEPKLAEAAKKASDKNDELANGNSGKAGISDTKNQGVSPTKPKTEDAEANMDAAADKDGLTALLAKEKQMQDVQKELAKAEAITRKEEELAAAQSAESVRKNKRSNEAERKRQMDDERSAAGVARKAAQEAIYEASEGANIPKTNAQFPGGDDKLRNFISRKKNYTNVMREQNLTGVIAVTFDVEHDGRVSNARIKSGENGQFKADALRVIRSMPKWEPATLNGEPIKSTVTLELIYGEE